MPRRSGNTVPRKQALPKQPAMDAIDLLKHDHEEIRMLFEQIFTSLKTQRRDLAFRIFKELEIHGTLEEELFYPALVNQGDPDELVSLQEKTIEANGEDILEPINEEEPLDETLEEGEYGDNLSVLDIDDEEEGSMADDTLAGAYEDHQRVKELIHRLRTIDPGTSDFLQGIVELEKLVSEHVAQEEESLFVEAKLRLDVKTLGEQMMERKRELLSTAAY